MEYAWENPTKLYVGLESMTKLFDTIEEKKVLLLFGGGSIRRNGAWEDVHALAEERGIEIVQKGNVRANPIYSFVKEATEIVLESGAEAILAVGGGSVLDTAKAIVVDVQLSREGVEGKDVWDCYLGELPVPGASEHTMPIYACDYMTATGSGMNTNSVLQRKIEGSSDEKKCFLGNASLYPKALAINPKYMTTLSPYHVASIAFDGFTHISEYLLLQMQNKDKAIPRAGRFYLTSLQKSLFDSLDRLVNPEGLSEEEVLSTYASLGWAATQALNFSVYPGDGAVQSAAS
ncbi:hypothetical protein PCE1_002437 [Barthelona sp. PCE]